MGGTDYPSNLVEMSAREHFVAHWLLWKIHKTSSMAHAFFAMTRNSEGQYRTVKSFQYEIAKKAMSLAKSGTNNHWFGTRGPQSGKSKENDDGVRSQSIKLSKMRGELRSPKQREWDAKKSEWAKDNNMAPPSLEKGSKKMTNGMVNKFVSPSEIVIYLESGWRFGSCNTSASKGKKRGKIKPREIVTCDHCGKVGNISQMKRWHFENCKHKQ